MKWLAEMVLKPLLRRAGTVLASAIVFGGDWLCSHVGACGLVTPDGATLVAAWVVAAALVCVDLAFGWLERKRIADKAQFVPGHVTLNVNEL